MVVSVTVSARGADRRRATPIAHVLALGAPVAVLEAPGSYNQGMSKDVKDVFRDAAALSEHDRATLAGLLIESLDGESDTDVEAAWAAEIKHRVAELEAGTVETIPWEDVRHRLLNRLNAR